MPNIIIPYISSGDKTMLMNSKSFIMMYTNLNSMIILAGILLNYKLKEMK